MTRILLFALATTALAPLWGCMGCDVDDPSDVAVDDRAGTSPTPTSGWGCKGCGFTNSAYLGSFPLESFALGVAPQQGEARLVGIVDASGVTRTVGLDDDAFTASKNNTVLKGGQLVGWTLLFDLGLPKLAEVKIHDYQLHADWVTGTPIDTYALAYLDRSSGEAVPLEVCPGLGFEQTSIVLLPGETYDMDGVTVEPGQAGHVTLACRGHALAKMKLMGYGPGDGYGSGWEQRQATLKMLTADYCGKGQSFTVVGTPLQWADEAGNFPLSGNESPAQLEAKWDHRGALCIDTPRLFKRDDVTKVCPLPHCNGDYSSFDGGTWISMRP